MWMMSLGRMVRRLESLQKGSSAGITSRQRALDFDAGQRDREMHWLAIDNLMLSICDIDFSLLPKNPGIHD
jgi:hypothetical protein